MLALQEDIVVAAEAAAFEEALAAAEAHSSDVILMDIQLGDVEAVEATRQLKKAHPSTEVIILSMYGEYLAPAIEAGVSGYLTKDVMLEELCQAIRAVHERRSALDLSLSRELFTQFAATLAQGVELQKNVLSPRE
jgi:DNA-binding NarL/FixJ family response regulator